MVNRKKVLNLELKADKRLVPLVRLWRDMAIKTGLTQSYLSTSLIASTSFLPYNFNNLSNQGFSFADYNTLMGAVPLAGTWRRWWFQQRVVNFGNNNTGQIKSATAGMNFTMNSHPNSMSLPVIFKLLRSKFNQTQLQRKFPDRKLFSTDETRHPTPTGPDTL